MNKSPILDRCILCPLGCTRPPPPQTCCRLRNKRDEEDSDGDDEELPPSAEEAAKRAKAKEEYKDQCRKVGCTSSAGRGVRYCSQPVRRPHACIFRGGISMALRGHVLLTRLLSLKTLSRSSTSLTLAALLSMYTRCTRSTVWPWRSELPRCFTAPRWRSGSGCRRLRSSLGLQLARPGHCTVHARKPARNKLFCNAAAFYIHTCDNLQLKAKCKTRRWRLRL